MRTIGPPYEIRAGGTKTGTVESAPVGEWKEVPKT